MNPYIQPVKTPHMQAPQKFRAPEDGVPAEEIQNLNNFCTNPPSGGASLMEMTLP